MDLTNKNTISAALQPRRLEDTVPCGGPLQAGSPSRMSSLPLCTGVLFPALHADKWAIPDESQRIDLAVTNQLALAYGLEPGGPQKEGLLLQLLQNFPGYLVMIVRGTLPHVNSPAGREAKEFLRMLAPKGAGMEHSMAGFCQMLHLASKQQTTEDIYDTLVFCFVRAARKYDPLHAEKVHVVCEGIDAIAKQEFTAG